MKITLIHLFLVGVAALLLGGVGAYGCMRVAGFRNYDGFTGGSPVCESCGGSAVSYTHLTLPTNREV